MSWLKFPKAVHTLEDAVALRADLWSRYRLLQTMLANELGSDVQARCEARVAALCGAACELAPPSRSDDVVLEFVEQYVRSPDGVTDELVSRLAAELSPRGVVALTMAVSLWEGGYRLAHALEVAPSA